MAATAPPTAHNIYEFARALSGRCYPHTGSTSIQEVAIDVSRRGLLLYLCYLLDPLAGNKEEGMGLMTLGVRPSFTRFPVFIPRWITHPSILYQVCATRGARMWVLGKNLQVLQGMILMAHRVRPKPTRIPANILYISVNSTILHSVPTV